MFDLGGGTDLELHGLKSCFWCVEQGGFASLRSTKHVFNTGVERRGSDASGVESRLRVTGVVPTSSRVAFGSPQQKAP